MRRPRAVGEVATAPFRIQSVRDSDRFDQGRFAGAVFADKECDLGVKWQIRLEAANGRETERVLIGVGNTIAAQLHIREVRAGAWFGLAPAHDDNSALSYAYSSISVDAAPMTDLDDEHDQMLIL
jgi:hypothetical protein